MHVERRSSIDWEFILDTIKESRCVVFLGPDFPRLTNGLSYRMAAIKHLDVDNNSDISAFYQNDEIFLFRDKQAKIRTIFKLKKFYRENKFYPKTYELLSKLPVKLYVNAGPDNFLSQAMDGLNYSYNFEYFNKHFAGQETPEPNSNLPLIYNLTGSFLNDDSLLLTHDDLFAFLSAALSEQKLPQNIMAEVFQSRSFLFLGVNFDKWYVQLMLRLLRLHEEDHVYVRYATKKNFNADTISICVDQFQIEFVNHKIEDFIEELYQRCMAEDILRKNTSINLGHENIREMVEQDQIDQVFEIFKIKLKHTHIYNEFLLLANRFQRLKKRMRANTISYQDSEIERNQIISSLISFTENS